MTHPLSKPQIDMTGRRYGRLMVKAWVVGGERQWSCVCDCGAEVIVRGGFLRSGKTKSCGCLRQEKLTAGLHVKHGMCGTRTYKSWDSMIRRCTNQNDPSFDQYGGKGISACAKWLDFDGFFADMGERPVATSIDRIDGSGNYEPGNCRWANRSEQQNNISSNRIAVYQGMSYTARQLSDLTGVGYDILRERIFKYGWSPERAVDTPVQMKTNRKTQGAQQ